MNILIVDDHPLFRHALIQAVRWQPAAGTNS